MASLLLAAVFGAAVQAVALESSVARPTDASIPYATVQLPSKVTEPPSPSLVRELLRRADVQTVLVGPDNTCGYVSGLIGAAYTCGDPNGYCAFLTTANVGYVACCDDSDCGFRADCYDAAQIENGDCNNGCMNDVYTAKCTASSAPYCGTIRFQGSITDFFCHSLSYSTVMDASTTYIGESDGRSFSELVVTLTSSSAGSGSTATGSGDGLDFGSSSTTGGSSGGTASGSSNSGSSSSSTAAAAGAGGKSSSSSSNIGPIVGGVVGGVAVIALVILGVWLIMRRNRRRGQDQQMAPQHPGAAPSAYPPMQQSPPPFAPGAPQDTGYSQQPYHDGAVMHQYNDKPQNWSTTSQQQVVPPYPPQGYPQQQQQGAGGVWYSSNNQEKPPGTESYAATSPSPGSPMSSSTSPLDPRMSMAQPPSSPASTERLSAFQPQYTGGSTFQGQGQPTVPSTVYESGGDAVGTHGQHANHHGQFHELGSN